MILGILVKQSQGYSGVQAIPNYSFWSDLPALVIAGALYIRARGRRVFQSSRNNEYTNLADQRLMSTSVTSSPS